MTWWTRISARSGVYICEIEWNPEERDTEYSMKKLGFAENRTLRSEYRSSKKGLAV